MKRGPLTRRIRVSKCEASKGFDFSYSYRLNLKRSSPLFTKRFFLAISVWRTDLVSGSKSMSWRISLAASAWCGAVNRAKPIGFSALKFNWEASKPGNHLSRFWSSLSFTSSGRPVMNIVRTSSPAWGGAAAAAGGGGGGAAAAGGHCWWYGWMPVPAIACDQTLTLTLNTTPIFFLFYTLPSLLLSIKQCM